MEYLSSIVFVLIKYFGYLFYLKRLDATFKYPKVGLKTISIIRLIFGALIGIALYAAFAEGRNIAPVYFTVILINRTILWFLVFQYLLIAKTPNNKIKYTFGGVLVSCILDIPATFGILTIIGGIC